MDMQNDSWTGNKKLAATIVKCAIMVKSIVTLLLEKKKRKKKEIQTKNLSIK